MPRKEKPITLNPTPEFRAWFQAFCEQWEFTEGEGLAAIMKAEVTALGFHGHIMNKRGSYPRKKLGDNP
jgi:hypothetical protein